MHRFRQVLFRLQPLFRKKKIEAEMSEEMRVHLEMATEANLAAGMSPDEARAAARREFGGVEQIKESYRDQRGLPWLEDGLRDLRFAARLLRKSPGFTITAVAILALGIGANTAIFSVVNAFMLRPLPYDKANELVVLYENSQEKRIDRFAVAGPKYLEWRKQNTVFQELGALSVGTQNLTGGMEPVPVVTCQVTPSCLRVWRFRPELGRLFAEDEDQAGKNQLVILTHRLWQARFGGRTDVIGQTIRLDGKLHTVIGVLTDGGLANWDGSEAVFIPLAEEKVRDGPGVHYYQAFGRMKPGITLEQCRAEMTMLTGRINQHEPRFGDWGVVIVSLREDELGEWPGWQTILLLQGAVLAVLLIACANTANLLLARAASRKKEIAIRLAMGGSRGRVIRQLLIESMLLALLGGAAGVALAAVGLGAANRWLVTQDITLWTTVRLDPGVLAFSVGLSVLTGVVFGLVPAWQTTKADVQSALKGTSRNATGGVAHRRTLDALVVVEIGLALILLIGAGLFLRNLVQLRGVHPGYDPTNVLALNVALTEARYPGDDQRNQFVASALERLQTLPGVRGAAASDMLPLRGGSSWDLWVEGRKPHAPNTWGGAQLRRISPDYFRTMGGTLLSGRTFTAADRRGSESVAIISESLARRFFPGEDPIGAHVGTGDGIASPHTIVGVVRDERIFGVTSRPEPVIYVPCFQGWFKGSRTSYNLDFAVRTGGDPLLLAKSIQAEIRALDPEMAFANVQSLERSVSGSLLSQRLNSFMLGSFSLTALLLAALGIYGVMANAVSQRTNELGIRVAIGASARDILRLVVGRGLWLTALGVTLGLAGALAFTRFLKSFLFDISPTDPWVFAGVTLFLAAIALVACWLPARRATKVDPVAALRAE
ncbi:MAG TPA: ABC transporter permease [Opitutaceae bacterium]|nr:ABC transporter permease [Opitutaceae bacterium]